MAMQLGSYTITAGGYRQLTDELEYLSSIGRQQMADRLREAHADGALADNPALGDLLEQQAALETRIAFLSQQLGYAQIAHVARGGAADIGAFVTVRDTASGATDEYELVAEIESDASVNKLSVEAPIGSALLGLTAGSVVSVEAPRGDLCLEVVRVGAHPSGGGSRH